MRSVAQHSLDVASIRMGTTARIASAVAGRVKGHAYEVDPALPSSYLAGVMLERATMRARGAARVRGLGKGLFLGRGARIRCARQFRFGSGATVGVNAYIDAGARNGVTWGDNVALGRNSRIECTGSLQHAGVGMRVGNNVGLGTDSFYGAAGGITIGSDVLVGNFVSMHSENHIFEDPKTLIREQGTTHRGIVIGDDCWIGARVTVLDGVRLGTGCVVAAGAVLRSGRYEDYTVYGGVPARPIGSRGRLVPSDTAPD